MNRAEKMSTGRSGVFPVIGLVIVVVCGIQVSAGSEEKGPPVERPRTPPYLVEGKPYTGVIKVKYTPGEEGFDSEEVPVGERVTVYENGVKVKIEEWESGEKRYEAVFTSSGHYLSTAFWYVGGKPRAENHYQPGPVQGRVTQSVSWDEAGRKTQELTLDAEGRPNQTTWHEGQVVYEIRGGRLMKEGRPFTGIDQRKDPLPYIAEYVDGWLVRSANGAEANLKKTEWDHGFKRREVTTRQGVLVHENLYEGQDRLTQSRSWHPNGKPSAAHEYADGLSTGYRTWDAEGHLTFMRQYVHGGIVRETWVGTDGYKVKEIIYDNHGVPQSEVRWDSFWLGITVQPALPFVLRQAGVEKGVEVLTCDPKGPAVQAGVKVGDVLLTVDDEPVESPQRLTEIMAEFVLPSKVTLDLWQGGKRLRVRAMLAYRAPEKAEDLDSNRKER